MEGPLSKWTNVVHGWQFRWFVLDSDALCYYTSREKLLKQQQRGFIPLRGATIGINSENSSLFTIKIDGKTFHLQGRDKNDRDRWVCALESTINQYSRTSSVQSLSVVLERRVLDADAQLQRMITEIGEIEKISLNSSIKERKAMEDVVQASNRLLDIVRHCVILLEMTIKRAKENLTLSNPNEDVSIGENIDPTEQCNVLPSLSYSSSEDEFFDAESFSDLKNDSCLIGNASHSNVCTKYSDEFGDSPDEGEDFDSLYEDTEESALGDIRQHGSVLKHLLSQVKLGMDLTKVTLPTFILERRSLLEMYADFFAYPDEFAECASQSWPEERFISVVKYYIGAFYAARKSGIAKKPYNPILGETFRCRWSIPGLPETTEKTIRDPFPGSDLSQLTFIAEQVSHHPPISAFHAELPCKKISLNAHIWTKSFFLGIAVGVNNIGWASIKLSEFNEEYKVTFPDGYGRSILSTPWIELGGEVSVSCEETGYSAEISFLTKPFLGGKPHRIEGKIFSHKSKKPILTLRGEWNGIIYAKRIDGEEYEMVNVQAKSEVKKECVPVNEQGSRESRRLWRHVTLALKRNQIDAASSAKHVLEQQQRDEAKYRLENNIVYEPRFFIKCDDDWIYKESLQDRGQV